MGFPSDIQEKALVACARRCCICHKFCSFKIELHHIVQKADGGEDTFDNCIPLCFDCHADVKAYNARHPKGKKYTDSELKAHRDQWYQKVQNDYQSDPFFFKSIHERKIEKKDTEKSLVETISSLDTILSDLNNSDSQGATENTVKNLQEKDRNTSNSVDYTFSAPETFKKELELLFGRIKNLNDEKQSAVDLGLKGPVKATEKEIQTIQLQIQILQKRIEIIEQGYEFWDKIGFLSACEACYIFDSWHSIGVVEDGQFTGNEDVDVRIPKDVLKTLKPAIESKLFKEFILCVAVEPPDDPDSFLAQWVGYYLFGSPPNLDTSENDDLFLIDGWNDEGFE